MNLVLQFVVYVLYGLFLLPYQQLILLMLLLFSVLNLLLLFALLYPQCGWFSLIPAMLYSAWYAMAVDRGEDAVRVEPRVHPGDHHQP